MAQMSPAENMQVIGDEIRSLAENMLKELENGQLGSAVALVNDLSSIRDRTLYHEIGKLTRALHESIKNLNVDTVGAGSDIEHVNDKLTYVVEMTAKSANRTMDLVDASMPLAEEIGHQATQLSTDWQRFLNKELKPDEFRQLSRSIQQFLQTSASNSRQLQGQLSEVMLAQDFQDLTGQVIQKVAVLIRDVENRLVSLVSMAGNVDSMTGINHDDITTTVDAKPLEGGDIAAEGPQIDTSNENVVSSQDDVDDLLSSLGF